MTVVVKTVLDAEEIFILISRHNKSHAFAKVVEEGVNHIWTVSVLQVHPKGMFVCDEALKYELKAGRVKYFKDLESKHLEPGTQLLRKKRVNCNKIGIYKFRLNWYRRREKNTLQAKAAIIPLPNRQYVIGYLVVSFTNIMPIRLYHFLSFANYFPLLNCLTERYEMI